MDEPRSVGIVVVSAALSAIPTIGRPLQTTFDAIAERRRYRVELTAREIAGAAGEDRMVNRVLDDAQFEALLAEALEAAAKTGFEAKRRVLGRAVAEALLSDDEAALDSGVLVVAALAQLEPVHVRALIRLENATAVSGDPDDERRRSAIEEFNRSQPMPVLAALDKTGVMIPGTFLGASAHAISNFGTLILRELRAVADEDMERLAD
jgi:hypothetical protein